MLTLDPALAAAQDSMSRDPLVEIISAQATADIPFDGSYLTTEATYEKNPVTMTHSSGRLVTVYSFGPYIYNYNPVYAIKFVYTNVDRTQFYSTYFQFNYSDVLEELNVCEMANGNIGIVYRYSNSGVTYLRYKILSVTGTEIADGTIGNWSSSDYSTGPYTITLANGTYLMIYVRKVGTDYKFYKRTSNNFTTWGAEAEVGIGGLISTSKIYQPYIVQIIGGDVVLWFAYVDSVGPNLEELTNLYCSFSTDNGVTFSNAVARTNFTTFAEVGKHPIAVQKAADTMHVIFDRIVPSLHMDASSTGWNLGGGETHGMVYDTVNQKLYFVETQFDCLCGVAKVDKATWTIENFWGTGTDTVPSFPSYYKTNNTIRWEAYGAGQYVVLRSHLNVLSVLDGENNTITNYFFRDQIAQGFTQNVEWNPIGSSGSWEEGWQDIGPVFVDPIAKLMYCTISNGIGYSGDIMIGYIDLTEAAPSPPLSYYTFTVVIEEQGVLNMSQAVMTNCLVVVPDEDFIMLAGATGYYKGWLRIWNISTGGLYRMYNFDDYPQFPYWGINYPHYLNGKVYGGMIRYESLYGEDTKRGLLEINLLTDAMRTIRPSWATIDNYYLQQICNGATNELIIATAGYGITIFNTIDESWLHFDNTTMPGFCPTAVGYEAFSYIAYDSTDGMVFGGISPQWTGAVISAGWFGVIMFSRYGYIQQASYFTGVNAGGWTFGDDSLLVQGYNDYNAVVALDPNDQSMYVFWVKEELNDFSIKWDKENSAIDLGPYLVDEISTEHSIAGDPASLSFTVSHGHLFDPYNMASLFRTLLKKGRKITIRWGEMINGTPVWQNAGMFYVAERTMRFAVSEYPLMDIVAKDLRELWSHKHIYATDPYTNMPDFILGDVLKEFTTMTDLDLDFPTFDVEKLLYIQWIETDLNEILTQVCERFGYYFRFDVDGKATARKITNIAAVDHVYPDNTKLLDYTPDDKYSDFTNRVTVRGQERDFTQVTFPEERITQLSGTLGWWGCKKDHKVWYSDDRSRRAINPKMRAIETSTSIPFKLAGKVHERITACPVLGDDKYCTVEVEAPNLIGLLIASIAVAIGGYMIPDGVVVHMGSGTGHTIPIGRLIEKIGIVAALFVLGSVANYQLEVWAQPLGNVRRSVQASWDDTENQTEIDAIVEKVIDDPLCYSAPDCSFVASFEGMVVQMQKKRVNISKMAHLQDEDGDTITIPHPHSMMPIDMYITKLKRRYKKSSTSKSNDGYFQDEIESWVCSG